MKTVSIVFVLTLLTFLACGGGDSTGKPEIDTNSAANENTTSPQPSSQPQSQTSQRPREDTLIFAPFSVVSPTFPRAPRPIFLYLKQNNCQYCEMIETTVFNRPEIARYVNQRYIPVKVNINADLPLTIMGKQYNLIDFKQLLQPHGIPAYYFFDTDGKLIGMLDSAMPLKTFKQLLVYVENRHFMRTTWQDFLKLPEADVDTAWNVF